MCYPIRAMIFCLSIIHIKQQFKHIPFSTYIYIIYTLKKKNFHSLYVWVGTYIARHLFTLCGNDELNTFAYDGYLFVLIMYNNLFNNSIENTKFIILSVDPPRI